MLSVVAEVLWANAFLEVSSLQFRNNDDDDNCDALQSIITLYSLIVFKRRVGGVLQFLARITLLSDWIAALI